MGERRTVADAAAEQWGGPGAELAVPDDETFDAEEVTDGPSRMLAPLADTRPVREPSRTVGENIDYAEQVAGELPPGVWRSANLLYVRTLGAAVKLVLRALDWGFDSLARAIGTVLVLAALAFVLNQLPVTGWLVPDQWDLSSWLPQHDPELVEVPIVAPGGAG